MLIEKLDRTLNRYFFPLIYRVFKFALWSYMHFWLKLKFREKAPIVDEAAVFAVNHPTVWDAFPPLIYHKPKYLHVLIEEQIWSFAVPRILFTISRQIPLYTGADFQETIQNARYVLSRNAAVLTSPEGGRTDLMREKRGRKMPVRLAIESKVPVVPIGVWLPKEKIKEKRVNYNFKGEKYFDITPIPRFRAPYGVVYGEPIYYDEYHDKKISPETYQKLADELLNRCLELSEDARKLVTCDN
jgi:1-acyl-sn-glycerol-3-phosphate acyltransferase